jgi:hypothetical protein
MILIEKIVTAILVCVAAFMFLMFMLELRGE